MIEAQPPPDAVGLVREEQELGAFSWAQDGSATVTVMCVEDHRDLMSAAANEYAQLLGCMFSEFRTDM